MARSESIAAALAEAAGEEEAESTPVEAEDSQEETTEESPQKGKFIPKARLDEVIGQRNDLKEQLEALSDKYNETQESLTTLAKTFEGVKQDADIINDIRALAKDPLYKDHVTAIDRALRGVEAEVDKGDISEKEGADRMSKILQGKQEELAEQLHEQNITILTQQADAIADKWLEQLPEEYTEQDRDIIAQLWTSFTDFDLIEEDPNQMLDILKESFQQAIDKLGTPRGMLVDPKTLEETEETEVELQEPDPDELLAKLIEGKDYGKLVADKASGKSTPELSDEDFTRDLALAMKIQNSR